MVTAVISLDTSDLDGFGDALGTTGHLFENVKGFHGFDLLRGIEDSDRFLLLAKWNSVGDHETWQQAHVDEFLGTLNPYLSSPPDIKHFESPPTVPEGHVLPREPPELEVNSSHGEIAHIGTSRVGSTRS